VSAGTTPRPVLDHPFARPFNGAADRLASWAGARLGVRPVSSDIAPRSPESSHGRVESVLVIGGGLAGATAALRLAEAGVPVTVLERNPYLGGKLGAWRTALDDGREVTVEHGFHGFFLQYYNLFRLLSDIGCPVDDFPLIDDYVIAAADGRCEGIRRYPRTPPFNVLAMALRSPFLNLREARRMRDFGLLRDAFLSFDPDETWSRYDRLSFAELTRRIGLDGTGFDVVFKVFGHSFFSEASEVSAAEIAKNFHFFFFANPESLLFRYCRTDFERAIWSRWRARLEALGGRVELGAEVARLDAAERGFVATVADGRRLRADAIVLAVDPAGLRRVAGASRELLARSPSLARLLGAVPPPRPYAVVRLWLDRDCARERCSFTSVHGRAPLDSITVYHRLEEESARWAAEASGGVFELHAYTPDAVVASDPDGIERALCAELEAVFPELRGAGVRGKVRQVRWDFPSHPVGGGPDRLETLSPHPGLLFAGDYVRLPLPAALMEAAVVSGTLAANAIRATWGTAPVRLWSVPLRGVLRRERAAA
jgi:carotenoid phi-ring synthase / carotenoid chi-ring synthase